MAAISLDGARAKIERAGEHREALEKEVRAWVESNPHAVTTEATERVETEKTRWSVRVGDVCQPDPRRWALIFGDAVHNLRCALDQLFYAVAECYAPGEGLGQRTFPVLGQRERFWGDGKKDIGFKKRRDCLRLPEGVWTAIEREQPYLRRDEAPVHLLEVLNDLDIRDKHHALTSLLIVHPRIEWLNMDHVGGNVEVFIVDEVTKRGIQRLDKGTEIATLVVHQPRPNMQPYFRLATTVAIDIGLPDEPAPARLLLKKIAAEVEAVIQRVSSAVI